MQSAAITTPHKSRGAISNPTPRYASTHSERDNGYEDTPLKYSELMATNARSIISRNQSPDLPFSQSINQLERTKL